MLCHIISWNFMSQHVVCHNYHSNPSVHVHVCVYIYTYLCMHVSVHVCACAYVCAHVCMCMSMHVCIVCVVMYIGLIACCISTCIDAYHL